MGVGAGAREDVVAKLEREREGERTSGQRRNEPSARRERELDGACRCPVPHHRIRPVLTSERVSTGQAREVFRTKPSR